MSRRFRCWSCRTAFLFDPEAGGTVVCPKCGVKQGPSSPTKATPAPPSPPEASVFVPSEDAAGRGPRRWRRAVLAALALATGVGVGLVVAWPSLRNWWTPRPVDPIVSVASAYLKALVAGDTAVSGRIGTVDLPPAIRTFRNLRHDRARDRKVRGSFAPIAAFHAKLAETFDYDPATGRFLPRNPLGPAAETLDALHAAKEKAEKEGLAKKIESGDPDDLFDAAESLGKTFASLAEGALAPKKLIPSYRQLVDDAKPPLPGPERELILDVADHRETWEALLKRPFATLKADGPFLLERAEVTAGVIDALGSSGDLPTPLTLTLTRFRLEGIDTGWRVTATRRGNAPPAAPGQQGPDGGPASPGERYPGVSPP